MPPCCDCCELSEVLLGELAPLLDMDSVPDTMRHPASVPSETRREIKPP